MMDEDNSWVFDSLVCFLNGPIWDAPIQNFIEEKSLVFEPNVKDSDYYKKIFEEFKNLVDFMLSSFMEDIGITPEQFETACSESQQHGVQFDHNLFEQIWAANDYEMFKRMMTQRNVELQLQALELIEEKYGIRPQSFEPTKKTSNVSKTPVTIETNSATEKEVMLEISRKFPEDEPSTSAEVKSLLEEKEMLEHQLKVSKEKTEKVLESISKNKIKENMKIKTAEPKESTDQQAVKEDTKIFGKNTKVDESELKKRQEYLRTQRDKLVALKKEERKKQFESNTSSKDQVLVRPKSAKAAEVVLNGDTPDVESQQLHLRKALVERLKAEVVYKKES